MSLHGAQVRSVAGVTTVLACLIVLLHVVKSMLIYWSKMPEPLPMYTSLLVGTLCHLSFYRMVICGILPWLMVRVLK